MGTIKERNDKDLAEAEETKEMERTYRRTVQKRS